MPDPDSDDFESLCLFCEEHRVAVLASLPWVAAEIAGLGGFEAMLRLVRRHGGRLSVQSVVGEYAEFSLELLRHVPPPGAAS